MHASAFCGGVTWTTGTRIREEVQERTGVGRAQVLFAKRSDNFILELGTRGEKITSRQSRFEFVPCATEKLDLRARSFNLPLAAAGRMRI